MKRKNYSLIQNELFEPSDLSLNSRYLHCVLLKFSGQDDGCYPSQKTLGLILGCSTRHIRTHLRELEAHGLIVTKRKGYGKPNTYIVSKEFTLTNDRNFSSPHLGSRFPLQTGNHAPPNITYRPSTVKTRQFRGMTKIEEVLKKKGLR